MPTNYYSISSPPVLRSSKGKGRANKDYSDVDIIMSVARGVQIPSCVILSCFPAARLGVILSIIVHRTYSEGKHFLGAGLPRLNAGGVTEDNTRVGRQQTTPPRIWMSGLVHAEFMWMFAALGYPYEATERGNGLIALIGLKEWYRFLAKEMGYWVDSPDKRGFIGNVTNVELADNCRRVCKKIDEVYRENALPIGALDAFEEMMSESMFGGGVPVEVCPYSGLFVENRPCPPGLYDPAGYVPKYEDAWMYVMATKRHEFAKFGKADRKSRRFEELAAGCPLECEAYKLTPGGFVVEAYMLRNAGDDRITKQLGDKKIRTEWVKFTPRLRELCDRLPGPTKIELHSTIDETIRAYLRKCKSGA